MPTLFAALFALCPAPQEGGPTLAQRLKDPAQVWPAFQELLRAGEFGRAHEACLSRDAKVKFPVEALLITFSAFEASRRMMLSLEAHGVERVNEDTARVRLCSRDFGAGREVRLVLFHKRIWTLDFTGEDLEYLKGRTLSWFRHQVRKADGWHFAYPPDWTYAPLARHCICGK